MFLANEIIIFCKWYLSKYHFLFFVLGYRKAIDFFNINLAYGKGRCIYLGHL